jgi:hypothetical protein
MKKVLTHLLTAIVFFVVGYVTFDEYNNIDSLYESNRQKRELLSVYEDNISILENCDVQFPNEEDEQKYMENVNRINELYETK